MHKLLLGLYWSLGLILSQIILSSLSGVYLYKIVKLLFHDVRIATCAVAIYAIFPMTLWYVNTFSQETLFQCLFIFSVYYLIAAYKYQNMQALIFSAIFFSLAYLTKSHILLFALFIPLLFLLHIKPIKKAIKFSLIYTCICIIFSLPYGLYNKHQNNSYVLSSNGAGILFYLGNTNAGYISIVDVPEKGSSDYFKMKDITNTAGYFNGQPARYDSIMSLPQSIKQKVFFSDAMSWLKNNPSKLLVLKLYDIFYFLLPGVSYRHYPTKEWIISFLLSLPIYVLAYAGIIINLRKNFKKHFFILALFLTMVLFSVVFYVQNRFRTITIEPFYIIYASSAAIYFFEKYYSRKKIIKKDKIH